MSSALRFKFKSAKSYDTITFDGDFIKVSDLKVAIVERKNLNFGEGFDLEIKDSQTGEDYHDESALIRKNTSVEVRRVHGQKANGILSQIAMARKNERFADKGAQAAKKMTQGQAPTPNLGPKVVSGQDETSRIASVIDQQYEHPNSAQGSYRGGHRSTNQHRSARPGPNYVCHRCNKPGHWIDLCPTNGDPAYDRVKVRAPTGIPRSMLRSVDAPSNGTGLRDASGNFVTLQPNEEEFARQTMALRMSMNATTKIDGSKGARSDSEKKAGVAEGPVAEESAKKQQDAEEQAEKGISASLEDKEASAEKASRTPKIDAKAMEAHGEGDAKGGKVEPGRVGGSKGGGSKGRGKEKGRRTHKHSAVSTSLAFPPPMGAPPGSMPPPGVMIPGVPSFPPGLPAPAGVPSVPPVIPPGLPGVPPFFPPFLPPLPGGLSFATPPGPQGAAADQVVVMEKPDTQSRKGISDKEVQVSKDGRTACEFDARGSLAVEGGQGDQASGSEENGTVGDRAEQANKDRSRSEELSKSTSPASYSRPPSVSNSRSPSPSRSPTPSIRRAQSGARPPRRPSVRRSPLLYRRRSSSRSPGLGGPRHSNEVSVNSAEKVDRGRASTGKQDYPRSRSQRSRRRRRSPVRSSIRRVSPSPPRWPAHSNRRQRSPSVGGFDRRSRSRTPVHQQDDFRGRRPLSRPRSPYREETRYHALPSPDHSKYSRRYRSRSPYRRRGDRPVRGRSRSPPDGRYPRHERGPPEIGRESRPYQDDWLGQSRGLRDRSSSPLPSRFPRSSGHGSPTRRTHPPRRASPVPYTRLSPERDDARRHRDDSLSSRGTRYPRRQDISDVDVEGADGREPTDDRRKRDRKRRFGGLTDDEPSLNRRKDCERDEREKRERRVLEKSHGKTERGIDADYYTRKRQRESEDIEGPKRRRSADSNGKTSNKHHVEETADESGYVRERQSVHERLGVAPGRRERQMNGRISVHRRLGVRRVDPNSY